MSAASELHKLHEMGNQEFILLMVYIKGDFANWFLEKMQKLDPPLNLDIGGLISATFSKYPSEMHNEILEK